MITPAISVLSARGGLRWRRAPPLDRADRGRVILLVLFAFQRRGTGRSGSVFGPIVAAVVPVAVAALGLYNIAGNPEVLRR